MNKLKELVIKYHQWRGRKVNEQIGYLLVGDGLRSVPNPRRKLLLDYLYSKRSDLHRKVWRLQNAN